MVVRIVKLSKSLLNLTGNQNFAGQESILRLIYETMVKINFMIKKSSNGLDVFGTYIKDSLRFERQLHELIVKDIKENNGNESEIQKRMELSIHTTVEKAGFKIEDINTFTRKDKLPSVEEMSRSLDKSNRLYMVYRASSNEVHGGFSSLFDNITLDDNTYVANFKNYMSDARIMDAATEILISTVGILIENKIIMNLVREYIDRKNIIENNLKYIEMNHEKLLSQ